MRNFRSIDEMLSQVKDLDAVATLSQLSHLVALAAAENLSLYQTWHSQHAPGVASALRLLRQRRLLGARVTWKEDVRVWSRVIGTVYSGEL